MKKRNWSSETLYFLKPLDLKIFLRLHSNSEWSWTAGKILHQSLVCGVVEPRAAMTATGKSIKITAAWKRPLIGPHTNRCEKLFNTQCAFLLVHMRCSRFVSLNVEAMAGCWMGGRLRVLGGRKADRLRFYWWLGLIFKRYQECRLFVVSRKAVWMKWQLAVKFFIQHGRWRQKEKVLFATLTIFDFQWP